MTAQAPLAEARKGSSLRTNALLSAISTGMSFLTGTVLVFLQGRYLDVALFGQIGYAISFGSLIALIPNYGFDLLVIREIAQGKYSFGETLSSVVVAKALLSLVAILVAGGYIWLTGTSPSESVVMWVYLFSFIALSFTRTLGSLAKGHENFYVQAIAFAIQGVLVFVGTLVVILATQHVTAAANGLVALLGRLVGLAVAVLLVVSLAKRHGFARPSRVVVMDLLRAGFPFAIQIALSTAYFQIDTLLVRNLLGTEETGYYQAAMRFVMGINLFTSFVIGAFYPRVARAFRSNAEHCDLHYARKMMRLLGFLGFFAFMGLLVFSKPLILAIYGTKMVPSISTLRILSIIPLVRCVASGYGILLICIHRQRVQVYAAATATLLSVALNLWLLPQFGFRASAWVNVTVNVVILAIYAIVIIAAMRATLLEATWGEVKSDVGAVLGIPRQIVQKLSDLAGRRV